MIYPDSPKERTAWILSRRGLKRAIDPRRPYAFLKEWEASETGIAEVATLFLANRECPFRCLMCDLWQNTSDETVPPGAIPEQIDFALQQLPSATQVKLYNSGSFFDPNAIPPADYPAIAERVRSFERVIVECHPAFVGPAAVAFQQRINGQLEVAIGLETAHPDVLQKLNKRMTMPQFSDAAAFLKTHAIALRVFILVKPPFLQEDEALVWARRSIDFAFDCGAAVVSLIPTRLGNGALEALLSAGDFSPPRLATFEAAVDYGLSLRHGRLFGDLWDLEKFSDCPLCFSRRRARLEEMNLAQRLLPRVECACGASERPGP